MPSARIVSALLLKRSLFPENSDQISSFAFPPDQRESRAVVPPIKTEEVAAFHVEALRITEDLLIWAVCMYWKQVERGT